MFYDLQEKESQQEYVRNLTQVGGLSKLFSDSTKPFLHYRVAENIFCRSFNASNESRSDVSFDAVKGDIGIGIKTFVYRPSQVEKVAEFNRLSQHYVGLNDTEMVVQIAQDRNERIDLAIRLYDTTQAIYHCIARKDAEFVVYEVPMDQIDIDNIVSIKRRDNVITFEDGLSQYSFNISKSTLYKKFIPPNNTHTFPVEIIEDPYAYLSDLVGLPEVLTPVRNRVAPTPDDYGIRADDESNNVVILPLYSFNETAQYFVAERSGLNQWNASGRVRNENEAYIPIPAWIHKAFPDFFPARDVAFDLRLPNGQVMSAKVCQDGSKALMSNPNQALGRWLLRDVLELEPLELLTYERLAEIGVDSVEIERLDDASYRINFRASGTFEDFKTKNET